MAETVERPRVGVLPLYLALYDEVRPDYRPEVEAFARRVADRLEAGGLAVQLAPVCRVRAEVEEALDRLLASDLDLLATLHLAYSPSLEAVDALAGVDQPLILLDTTPAACFGPDATMDDMFGNHGIHGVQDLACMLRRRGARYCLAVGHVDDPAFVAQVARTARAAHAAGHLRSSKVLLFGDEFAGMGDFAVNGDTLALRLGVETHRARMSEVARRVREVTEDELAAEEAEDRKCFDLSAVSPEALRASNQVGLALRALLERHGANAFSFNFQSFDRARGVPTVPFLEASKAMARAVGYAGEGDALTAALLGSLLRGFGDATFTEMFCPDWEGGTIFMSHMGECNVALAAERPRLVEKAYAFGDVESPVVAVFPLKPGPATLVNIAPGPQDSFDLLAARVEVLDRGPQPGFPDVPHFWVRPTDADLPGFLEWYSQCGGTHHLGLVLGDQVEAIAVMARVAAVGFQTP